MRYYAIKVLNPAGLVMQFDYTAGAFLPVSPTFAPQYTWTSHDNNGVLIPGALNVELDIASFQLGTFSVFTYVKVWGVGLTALAQSANLSGYDVEIFAGMRPPYDLNSAAKSGQVAAGTIYQCYGNWEGVNQYLELVLADKVITPNLVADIPFAWRKGVPVGTAITNAMNAAFPGVDIIGAETIKPVVTDHDEAGHYTSMAAFASTLTSMTADPKSGYLGVQMKAQGGAIYLYDNQGFVGTLATAAGSQPITVQFQDLIGQPTWIAATNVSFATVMRADIQLGATVQLPPMLSPPYILTTPQAAFPNVPASNKLAFQGKFYITQVEHFGNFRDNSAQSWRTQYVGVPVPTPLAAAA